MHPEEGGIAGVRKSAIAGVALEQRMVLTDAVAEKAPDVSVISQLMMHAVRVWAILQFQGNHAESTSVGYLRIVKTSMSCLQNWGTSWANIPQSLNNFKA
jgi:hypothetical protein